jgi:predicted hotdog family 3-hydroxylacyl-ACP dehydratase
MRRRASRTMRLNRAWIEANIPHQGRMCLMEEVLEWDAEHIRCRSDTHRAPDNPLRSHGALGIACGIEYAAQSMAIHGALANGGRAEVGLLASLREVRFFVARLDDIESELICEVNCVARDGSSALYEFALRSCNRPLLEGRASVVLDANKRLNL